MILEKLDKDFYYHFFNGTLTNAYEFFGAHVKKRDNKIVGCEFLMYAPNAKEVCLIGEFNKFKKQKLKEINDGFFYLYIEKNIHLNSYKYVITTKANEILYKADPYAFYNDLRPGNNSKVYDLEINELKQYKRKPINNKPIIIYEIHLGSWKKNTNFIRYDEVVNDLVKYLIKHKYTHVEFLPIYEHPLDESWGYMGTGYYSPTARFGSPKEFIQMINKLHEYNIKVIMDWVPGHVCKDDFGLYKFDGTYLFEYDEYEIRENISWGTANLDLSKGITKSFLISNALFWLKKYNIDGFRIDAVSNLIYYLGDENRGINHNAISFLKELNYEIKRYDKNVLLTAEDSSAFPDVTNDNGLGFDFKWNMGWMNDTLTYFEMDPLYRKYNHQLITFSFSYIFKENYILPISHDEVVHLKKSLFSKMFGNEQEKFSSLRMFFGYMFFHPGKKLLFMGQELGQRIEWDCNKQIDFNLLENHMNYKLNYFICDLIKIYLKEESLYKTDNEKTGFKFIEADNNNQSVFIFSRFYKKNYIIIIMNALPIKYEKYKVGVAYSGRYKEAINSDSIKYGGENHVNKNIHSINEPFHRLENHIEINLAPLSIQAYKLIK